MTQDDDDKRRRRFLLRATATVGGACVAAAAYPMLASLAPSARARAAGAPVEADITGLASGELMTVAWRGKPVWIMRRTAAELAGLSQHDALLADPDSKVPQQPANCDNPNRSIKASIFVCVGICTHLGCSPSLRVGETGAELGANWPGGFFCPCHGSKFDLAGRVFKGVPAPTNLEVPPYRYVDASHILIGEEQAAA